MSPEAFSHSLPRLAISRVRLDPDQGLPRGAELLSEDAHQWADPRPLCSSAARWARSNRDR